LAVLPGELVWPVALPFGELSLLPLFCAFAAVVTGGAASGVGVTAGAATLPFPFPLSFVLACAPAVSAALVLVGAAASGVTGGLGAGEASGALVVVVEAPLVAADGSLVVVVAEEFPLLLSARASAGDTKKAAKARMQTESARGALWVQPERVDVSHVGVLTAPNRSPFKPSRKSSPFASLPREGECWSRWTIVLLDPGTFNRREAE
jgi:hypothetical protein